MQARIQKILKHHRISDRNWGRQFILHIRVNNWGGGGGTPCAISPCVISVIFDITMYLHVVINIKTQINIKLRKKQSFSFN